MAAGFILFEDGAALQIEAFWASHQPEGSQIELFGTEGGATDQATEPIPHRAGRAAEHHRRAAQRQGGRGIILPGTLSTASWTVPCQAPLRHGLIVQRMMEGVLRSAETGHEVALG